MNNKFIYLLLFVHLTVSYFNNEVGHYLAFGFLNILILLNCGTYVKKEHSVLQFWFLISLFNLVLLSLFSPGSIFARVLFIDYFFVVYILFFELSQKSQKTIAKSRVSITLGLYLLAFLILSVISNTYSAGRFSGFYSNALNFSGLFVGVASLIYLALSRSYFFVYVLTAVILAVMVKSKIIVAVLISTCAIRLYRYSKLAFCIISFAVFLALIAVYSYLDFGIVMEIYSLEPGAILHRLERYFEITRIGLSINNLANPTLCSKFLESTCLTSESFVFGVLLGYGLLSGSLFIAMLVSIARISVLIPFLVFMLLSAGLFTPSIIFVSYSVLRILGDRDLLNDNKSSISPKLQQRVSV